ncbi:unnamed protein product [Durusdinium trenchii]|uniref:Uncharacterized protein n=1 Tax=Durusdinium trenchii TaxID=1381693 RepID=A0ABP0LTX2_9DINO
MRDCNFHVDPATIPLNNVPFFLLKARPGIERVCLESNSTVPTTSKTLCPGPSLLDWFALSRWARFRIALFILPLSQALSAKNVALPALEFVVMAALLAKPAGAGWAFPKKRIHTTNIS